MARQRMRCGLSWTAVCVAVVGCGLTLVGCAHVAPYEREDLSRASMDAEREQSETAFRAHVHDAREGATGGHGSTGGGCGCN